MLYNTEGEGVGLPTDKINLLKALLKFQAQVPIIFKGTTHQGYGYKYSDMAEIMRTIQPILSKSEIGITQNVSINGSVVTVTTTLFHSSGEAMSAILSGDTQLNQFKGMTNIQVVGSLITYLRRYGVSTLLNLVTDIDNDCSNGVVDPNKPKVSEATPIKKKTKAPVPLQPPKKEEKDPSYIYDTNNAPRYNKTTFELDASYQREHGLIDNIVWREIKGSVEQNLGGNIKQFAAWLMGIYKVKFYDIKAEAAAGILKNLKEIPKDIMEYKVK